MHIQWLWKAVCFRMASLKVKQYWYLQRIFTPVGAHCSVGQTRTGALVDPIPAIQRCTLNFTRCFFTPWVWFFNLLLFADRNEWERMKMKERMKKKKKKRQKRTVSQMISKQPASLLVVQHYLRRKAWRQPRVLLNACLHYLTSLSPYADMHSAIPNKWQQQKRNHTFIFQISSQG